MVGGSAQLLKGFVRFSLGEGQPGLRFAEVGGLFIRDAVALFSGTFLAASDERRECLDVSFRAGYVATACRADGARPIGGVQPFLADRGKRQIGRFFPTVQFEGGSRRKDSAVIRLVFRTRADNMAGVPDHFA